MNCFVVVCLFVWGFCFVLLVGWLVGWFGLVWFGLAWLGFKLGIMLDTTEAYNSIPV